MGNDKSSQTVRKAVRHDSATGAQGFMQRLFAVWFDGFVYNQVWEDPRVDLAALRLNPNSRVLTISSGGCNALNYLIENPAALTAVDLNKNHIFLLNLKKAAIENLPVYEDFFEFFGYGKGDRTIDNFEEYIAPKLDANTLQFWESSTLFGRLFTGKRIEYFKKGGLYDHSRNGYFLRIFHLISRLTGCRPEEVLKAKSAGEQRLLYSRHVEPFFSSFVIRAVGKMPVTLFGLGIPPQQYAELVKDLENESTILDIYRSRARKLAVEYPIDENYFAWQAFGRKYDTEDRRAVPEYLKARNFETLRKNISRLRTSIGSVTEEIRNNAVGAFDRFVFLDAQDWMDLGSLTELWTLLAEKSESGARIIFRTAGKRTPLEKNLPKEVLARFEYHREESLRLFEEDRASIYGGFHLYTVR